MNDEIEIREIRSKCPDCGFETTWIEMRGIRNIDAECPRCGREINA